MSGWENILSNFETNDILVAGNPKDYKPTYTPELQEINAMKEELRHKPYKRVA